MANKIELKYNEHKLLVEKLVIATVLVTKFNIADRYVSPFQAQVIPETEERNKLHEEVTICIQNVMQNY